MPVLPGSKDLFIKQGQDVTISHVATGYQVAFPAFLELFSDAYTCNWDEETVYGRMDSIPTFRNTQRTLSLAWNVPADSFDDAAANVAKVNKLVSFLYPLYNQLNTGGGATAINQAPLVRVSFGNLVQNAVDGRGLLGHLAGLTFDPVLEHGMFYRSGNGSPGNIFRGTPAGSDQEYYPKTFRLNFELTVLHEHELGFGVKKGQFGHADSAVNFSNFPYTTGRAAPTIASNKPLKHEGKINVTPDPLQPSTAVEAEVMAVPAAIVTPGQDRDTSNDGWNTDPVTGAPIIPPGPMKI